MSDYKSALERVGSRVSPKPDGWDRIAERLHRRRSRRRIGVVVLALVVGGAGVSGVFLAWSQWADPARVPGAQPEPTSTRCESLIPECRMERLPDRILTGDEQLGALRALERVPEGIITFDDALVQAWTEDGHTASAVQVVLGSAEPSGLNWETTSKLFYAVIWHDVCLSPGGRPGSSAPPRCVESTWGTIIDAQTGAFIVGGTG